MITVSPSMASAKLLHVEKRVEFAATSSTWILNFLLDSRSKKPKTTKKKTLPIPTTGGIRRIFTRRHCIGSRAHSIFFVNIFGASKIVSAYHPPKNLTEIIFAVACGFNSRWCQMITSIIFNTHINKPHCMFLFSKDTKWIRRNTSWVLFCLKDVKKNPQTNSSVKWK